MIPARDHLFALIARIPGSGTADWCDDARRHLDAYRAEVLREAADKLMSIADETEAKVAEYYGASSGIGPGSAEMVREAAATVRSMAAAGKDTAPSGESTQPADFFQPGHGYTHRNGTDFHCVTITTHPRTGERLALGWHTDIADWTFLVARDINAWNHEYDGVEPPTGGDAR